MSLLQAYLQSPKARRVLNRKPGDKGFSLIELVVVVAVLAILAAIAIPSFTSISQEARVAGAKSALANLVKECAVKLVGSGLKTYTTPTIDSYTISSNGTPNTCGVNDTYTAAPDVGTGLSTFNLNASSGVKGCIQGTDPVGCNGTSW